MPRDLLSLLAVQVLRWSDKGRSCRKLLSCRACHATEVGITVLLVVLFCSSPALADTFGLGTAGPGNWGILETGANQVSISGPGGGITLNPGATAGQANLGINSGGKLNASSGTIPGTYYKFTGNSDSGSSSGTIASTTVSSAAGNATLATAASNATTASANLAGLTPNQTFAAVIATSTTINATVPGENVVNLLLGINLGNGTTLTLNGSASQSFVINIPAGGITLGSASILLTGGLTPANVIFNVTGGQNVSLNGAGGVINGIVMDLAGMVSLTNNNTIFGEVISGTSISMSNNSDVEAVQTVPEASTTAFFTLGPLSLLAVVLLYRRFSRRKQAVVGRSHDPPESVLDVTKSG